MLELLVELQDLCVVVVDRFSGVLDLFRADSHEVVRVCSIDVLRLLVLSDSLSLLFNSLLYEEVQVFDLVPQLLIDRL